MVFSGAECGNGVHRRRGTAAVGVALMAVLSFASGEGRSVVAAEATDDRKKGGRGGASAVEAASRQVSFDADETARRLLFGETPRKPKAEQLAMQQGSLDADEAARRVLFGETPRKPKAEQLAAQQASLDANRAARLLLFGDTPQERDADQAARQHGSLDANQAARLLLFGDTPREADPDQPISERSADAAANIRLAQFQLPRSPTGGEPSPSVYPQRPVIQHLTYEYSWGSESDIIYRRDPDLNKRTRDNTLVASPQLNGLLIYRPTHWLEATTELILEQPIYVHQEDSVTLPSGEKHVALPSRTSVAFNQAFVTLKDFTAPFQISVGRRNYEDPRHFLYDTSLDMASVQLKIGYWRLEALGGRPVAWDLDLLLKEARDRTDTYILYADYRGIEDIKLAGYALQQHDRGGKEGRPLQFGVSAHGAPSDDFSFWTQLAYLRGRDESRQRFSAYAIDIGGTYRFGDLPFNPNLTLGYAFGTGDGDARDNKNTEFRQSGMESNEAKFGGISAFKVYGEVLDPALSNLQILTAGLGIRPAPNVTVDLVYHRYRLDKLADEVRGSVLTAQMNQDDTQLSKEVGSAIDIVLGIRNLFDIRRLGLDLRAGLFFPGKAFRLEEGDPDNPTFRKADKGISIVGKFWF
jgi:alginate production protein